MNPALVTAPFVYQYPRVLTIAGSDSGGGAGIQADLKTFSALGCFGMSAITALTAQNTQGVSAIHAVPPEMLRQQIDAVVQDMGVHAVKIGMLHSPEVVGAVAQAIDQLQLPQVVLDPVMVATSGAVLIERPAVQALIAQLFGRVALVTGSGMVRSERASAAPAPMKKNRMAGDVKSARAEEKSGMGQPVR